jgi:hypothetical protein
MSMQELFSVNVLCFSSSRKQVKELDKYIWNINVNIFFSYVFAYLNWTNKTGFGKMDGWKLLSITKRNRKPVFGGKCKLERSEYK